ncbi:MAG: hypothetical protein ACP5HQ_05680 [Thermoprotei archaeon]
MDRGDKVCRPGEYTSITKGDSVLVAPGLLKVSGRTVMYPPLSLVSERCAQTIESPAWVDTYTVKGDEKLIVLSGEEEVEGDVRVEEPKFLTGFSFQKLFTRLRLSLNRDCPGVSLMTITGRPLLTFSKDSVYLCTDCPNPTLLALAYSVFYYIRPEE